MITSTQNPTIKLLRSLHEKKGRIIHQQFLAEGLRICSTLSKGNIKLAQLYATESHYNKALTITDKDSITLVSDEVMNKISFAATPSGIVGLFNIPKEPKTELLGTGLVMATISDPGNMGTLIRTAAALAIQSVVIVQSVDAWNPKVVQASAGTLSQVTIFTMQWPQLITLAKQNNIKLSALTVTGGKDPKKISDENRLLVVGSEAHGLPKDWIFDCDETITIPMPGDVESLNAAVAGSIALYLIFNK